MDSVDIKLFYSCYLFSDKLNYKERLTADEFSLSLHLKLCKNVSATSLFINCPLYFNLLIFCCYF